MHDSILIPTDGSLTAQRAIEHAVTLAEGFDADLEALYVVDTSRPFPGSKLWTDRKEEFRQGLIEDGEQRLTEATEPVRGRGVEIEKTLIQHDDIAQGIAEHAAKTGANMIVMGTHGRSGIERLVMGSVAERLVRLADVPVLLVPPTKSAE